MYCLCVSLYIYILVSLYNAHVYTDTRMCMCIPTYVVSPFSSSQRRGNDC